MSRSLEFQRQTPVWRWSGGDEVGYATGYDPSPAHPEFTPGAEVIVRAPKTRYDYEGSAKRNYLDKNARSDIYGDDHSTWQRGDGPHGQRSLFDVEHHHPYVGWLGTHPDFRGHIGTLLGVAATDSRRRFGESLRSDTSLSQESRRIVERAAAGGAVRMPDFVSPNDISSREDKYSNYVVATRAAGGGRNIPEPEIAIGRQFVRDVLRRPRQAIEKASEISGAKKAQQQEFFK